LSWRKRSRKRIFKSESAHQLHHSARRLSGTTRLITGYSTGSVNPLFIRPRIAPEPRNEALAKWVCQSPRMALRRCAVEPRRQKPGICEASRSRQCVRGSRMTSYRFPSAINILQRPLNSKGRKGQRISSGNLGAFRSHDLLIAAPRSLQSSEKRVPALHSIRRRTAFEG